MGVITPLPSKIFKAQLPSNYIDVIDSLRHSLKGILALLVLSPLFVDRIGGSTRLCHLELMRKPFLMVSWHFSIFFLILEGGGVFLKYF